MSQSDLDKIYRDRWIEEALVFAGAVQNIASSPHTRRKIVEAIYDNMIAPTQ